MDLTKLLKAWAIEHCDVKSDASDDEFKSAISMALVEGKLTAAKYAELSMDDSEKEADALMSVLTKLADSLSSKEEPKAEVKEVEEKKTEEKATKKVEDSEVKKALAGIQTEDVRVKGAWEQYDNTKTTAIFPKMQKRGPHPLAGQPMKNQGRTMNEPTDLDKAIAGVFFKFKLASEVKYKSKSVAYQNMKEHERELLQYAMRELKWAGASDGGDEEDIHNRKLFDHEQKALIDDGGASGGLEAAPIVFDDMVISAPLLTGELYPLVNEVPIPRGRRVEAAATGNVSGSWGNVDDTAISLFNTASYVTAFDNSIYRWSGAIHVGLDFLSDSPIDFGAHITAQYGERLQEDLDDVIAAGNGTTQPEGVINKTGIGTVNWAGTTSLSNYESLRFGVSKAEHVANANAVFCGSETSYQRARALAVGASDARRLFGLNYDAYAIMERPYKINESLNNQQIFYAMLGRYRIYRRRGFTLRQSTEGDTLIRDNNMLIVAMARFGGALERGACGVWTNNTAPA